MIDRGPARGGGEGGGAVEPVRPAGLGSGTVWLWGWWSSYLRWTRGEGLLRSLGDDANGRCGRVR